MRDTENPPRGDEPGDVIVIVQVRNNFWLLEGEEHLSAMLSGIGFYPTPVRCLSFASEIEFKMALPDCVPLGQLWGINPLIVDRLREADQIVDITLSE